ncbi:MAG TPA: hypothetical protein VE129_00435 [Thermoanaerobaculia bacterium]|nr:hypothetical protein [Thermoanaerobaculia bacterium]
MKALAGVSLSFLLLSAPAGAQPADRVAGPESLPFTAEELIRRVALAQGKVDRSLTNFTFDQLEVRTSYGRDGRRKETNRRLFHFFSGEKPGEATRELVEIDGRPATVEEKREQAEDDAKAERRQVERRAEATASRPPAVSGEEEDPLVGPRRLSDLIGRFDYRLEGTVEEEGRLLYALEFSPKPGLSASSLGDRALNALAGRVLVDASDFQIVSVVARLVSPVKVSGGLAANVKEATISYRGARLPHGVWFPCVVDLRLKGKTAVVFRLDTSFRFEFSGFASFSVETDSDVGGGGTASVQSAR